MAFYIFRTSSGRLISTGSKKPVNLPPGLDFKELAGDLRDNEWDEANKTLVPRPPRRLIGIEDFMARFTERELQRLLGLGENQSTANVRALSAFMKVTRVINLDGPIVQDALTDLVSSGRIDAQRKLELTANA